MTQKSVSLQNKAPANNKNDRLATALRANLHRRKEQARAREENAPREDPLQENDSKESTAL